MASVAQKSCKNMIDAVRDVKRSLTRRESHAVNFMGAGRVVYANLIVRGKSVVEERAKQ